MASIVQQSDTASAATGNSVTPSTTSSWLDANESKDLVSNLTFRGQPLWKRLCDLLIASFVTVAVLPLLVTIAVVIKVGSKGPIFFRQTRFGAMGRPFQIWKFRTMVVRASEDDHTDYLRQQMQTNGEMKKLNRNAELVPFGGIMRRLTVDELPQLINIFSGDMSIVGPRPDVIALGDYEPSQRKRFEVLPGVTGLWQVSGKNNTTFSEMMELDAAYAERRSLWLDLRILALTPFAVLRQAIAKSS